MSMRARLATTIRLTISAFRSHNASRFGAALAFYIVFSIAPTLLIAIGIVGKIFGRNATQRAILAWIGSSFGSATGDAIASMIKPAVFWQAGWVATVIGFASLYFGLGGIYRQIDDALQTIWGGPVRTRRTVRSVLLVVATAVVVLLAVVADGVIGVLSHYANARLAGAPWIYSVLQLIASALILAVLFALVFRSLAHRTVPWRDVSVGAIVTAVLFVIGKFALGIYLGRAAVGSPFGAAGSVVVVLLWSYWSAQIFFVGLEFTHVHAQRRRVAE